MGFNIPYTDKKRVVIIGGGFGGLKLAEKLKKEQVSSSLNRQEQLSPVSSLALSSSVLRLRI